MAEQIKYVTSDKLKSYLELVDKVAYGEVLPPAVVLTFEGKLSHSDNEKIDLIITGIRVYIRVMQGIDVDVTKNPDWQTNIDFFYQTLGTEQGNRGKKFAEILKTSLDLKGNTGINFSEIAQALIKTIPVYGQAVAIIQSVLNVIFDFSGQAQRRAEDFADGMKHLFEVFQNFMKDYQTEYLIQYPPIEDPIDPTIPKDPIIPTVPKTPVTPQPISGTNNNAIIWIVLIIILIIILRRK